MLVALSETNSITRFDFPSLFSFRKDNLDEKEGSSASGSWWIACYWTLSASLSQCELEIQYNISIINYG